MADTLTLADGRWKVTVAPSLGGSLLACEHDGAEVFRPTPQPAGGGRPAMRSCHFPLVPWSNRVEGSRFRFDGVDVALAPNVDGSAHAMHGHGWQAAWRVVASGAASCTLTFERAVTADWPWAYRATQRIALADGALAIDLGLENRGAAPMPGGLGFHPFLPRTAGARLAFAAERVSSLPAGEFPGEAIPVPDALSFRDAPRIADREGTDHCFEDWSGEAVVADGTRTFRLSSSATARYAIVYVPAGGDYFCLEPVTHAVNAMNRRDAAASGLWRLAPGEARRASLSIAPAVTRRG